MLSRSCSRSSVFLFSQHQHSVRFPISHMSTTQNRFWWPTKRPPLSTQLLYSPGLEMSPNWFRKRNSSVMNSFHVMWMNSCENVSKSHYYSVIALHIGLFIGSYRCFHWLLQSCAGNWVKMSPLKQLHRATQHNRDQPGKYKKKLKLNKKVLYTLRTLPLIIISFSLLTPVGTHEVCVCNWTCEGVHDKKC